MNVFLVVTIVLSACIIGCSAEESYIDIGNVDAGIDVSSEPEVEDASPEVEDAGIDGPVHVSPWKDAAP